MPSRVIHLLHLMADRLRWFSLTSDARGFVLLDSGELAGTAQSALNTWEQRVSATPGHIYLYDARPVYYSFKLFLPRSAAVKALSAIELKVRQELGMDIQSLVWTSWLDEAASSAAQAAYSIIVARCASFDDLRRWNEDQQIGALWVGADIHAVGALAAELQGGKRFVLLNTTAKSALAYYVSNGHPVRKTALAHAGSPSTISSGFDLTGAQQIIFNADAGEPPAILLSPAQASWAALPISDLPDFASNTKYRRLVSFPAEQLQRDAVLLGGMLRALDSAPAVPSLLQESKSASFLRGIKIHRQWRRAAIGSVVCMLLLIVSVWSYSSQRSKAGSSVGARAARLRPVAEVLNQQAQTLQQIRGEKPRAMSLIFEAIHGAAPDGILLESLLITQNGQIKMQGSAPQAEAASKFFKGLSESEAFVPGSVQLPEVKPGQNNKVTFQISAQARARAKR